MAALLFYVDAVVRIREAKTCTQEKAYWLMPQSVGKIVCKPVSSIDFTSAKSKKKQFDCNVEKTATEARPCVQARKTVQPPTHTEFLKLMEDLDMTETPCAILSIISPYSDKFVPKQLTSSLPKPLPDLKSDKFIGLSPEEMMNECMKIDIGMSKEECSKIEEMTRGQTKDKLWFLYRAGRITASKMKAVCRTNMQKPSQSLLKTICNPQLSSFTTAATSWGCDHEKIALQTYENDMRKSHHNFIMSESGLFINPSFPHIGASPDSTVQCDCCGEGLVEIKCPYCLKDKSVNQHDCLIADSNGKLSLNPNHQYYYQVQTQMFVCKREYCDFFIWTPKGLFQQRVLPNNEFWNDVLKIATFFFRRVVLPELLGGSVVDKSVVVDNTGSSSDVKGDIWCYCKAESHGKMIACDNDQYEISWFNFACVGIKRKPRGSWLCPSCK